MTRAGATRRERPMDPVDLELANGDVLELGLPGGGGVGPPEHRGPHALARDVTYGYVSPEASRTRYGTHR